MCNMSEDTKQILLEFNAVIFFNKDYKVYNFTTHYIQIIFNGTEFQTNFLFPQTKRVKFYKHLHLK